ncbi:MAG: GTPase Era, partial [Nitrospirae bacterium]|nr:GTPase Era [Nitrospirota bacterium]
MSIKEEKEGQKAPVFKTGSIGLIGRPNVGKSTLLNRILGEKLAIVSDKPQTTRNRILGIKNDPDAQILLIDTPGLHKPKTRLNEMMVRSAVNVILEADVIFLLMEMGKKGFSQDEELLTFVTGEKRGPGSGVTSTPLFLVITKADLARREELLPVMETLSRKNIFDEVVPVSALKNENIDRLIDLAKSYLPEGPPLFPLDEYTDQPVRFLAAELIREKIIQKVYQEVPYSVAVQIESYEEKPEKHQ